MIPASPVRRQTIGAAQVFACALAVRLLLAAFTPAAPVRGDADEYDRLARAILDGRGYVAASGLPTSGRPPLYGYLLAGVYAVFDDGPAAARVLQAFIDAGTCALVYLLAVRHFGVPAARIAAVFAIFSLSLLFTTRHLLTETLATFLMAASVLAVDIALTTWYASAFVMAGVLIALSTLTRGTAVVLPAVLMPPIWVAAGRRWGPTLRAGLLLVAGFAVTLAPWTIRNYRVHGEFVPVSTQSGHVVYSSYLPPEGKLFGFTTHDETVLATPGLSEVERSRALTRAAWRHVRDNLGDLPRLQMLKVMYLVSPFDWELLGGDGVFNFTYAVMVPLALYGLWIARSDKWRVLLLVTPLAFTLLMTLALYGSPRLRLPAEPFGMVLAGHGLATAWARATPRRRPLVAAALVSAVVAGMVAYMFSADVKTLSAQVVRAVGLW